MSQSIPRGVPPRPAGTGPSGPPPLLRPDSRPGATVSRLVCSAVMVAIAAMAMAEGGCGALAVRVRVRGAALRPAQGAAPGALAYRVAFAGPPAGPPRLVSVELTLDFELVVRRVEPGGHLTETGRIRLGPPDWDVTGLAIAPGGTTAYVASAAGTVRAIDLASGRTSWTWHLGDAATEVAISPDGRYLAAGGRRGILCLRRLADHALLQCAAIDRGPISGLSFSASGARLATSSWDGRVSVWSVPALAELASLDTGGSANDVAFAPRAGGPLAVALSGAAPRRTPAVAAHEPRDPRAAVLVWWPVRGRAPQVLRGHTGPVTAVAWTRDGRHILSGSWDRSVRMWDADSGRELGRVSQFSHLVRDLATDPGGRWAAVAAWTRPGATDAEATRLLGLDHPP